MRCRNESSDSPRYRFGPRTWSEYITLLQTIPGIDRPSADPRRDRTRKSAVPSASPHGRRRAMTAAPASAARPVLEAARRGWRGTHPRVPVPRLPQGVDGPCTSWPPRTAGALRRVAPYHDPVGTAQRPALANAFAMGRARAPRPPETRGLERRRHRATDRGRPKPDYPVAASTTVRATSRRHGGARPILGNFHGNETPR